MNLRKLLNEVLVRSLRGQTNVALAFSAGTDSCCLLFSLLELGAKPVCYTYNAAGNVSADLRRARKVTEHYGLSLVECTIPADNEETLAMVKRMIRNGVCGKVCLQCMHGHYIVAAHVREPLVFNGSGVDGLYGSYLPEIIDGSKDRLPKEEFDRRRRKHLDNPNDDAMLDQAWCYKMYAYAYGAEVVFPYRDPSIVAHLMALDWASINRPKLKWEILQHYPEFQEHQNLWRPRGSQQIVSGVRSLHDSLLDHPANTLHRTNISAFYRDLIKEEPVANETTAPAAL